MGLTLVLNVLQIVLPALVLPQTVQVVSLLTLKTIQLMVNAHVVKDIIKTKLDHVWKILLIAQEQLILPVYVQIATTQCRLIQLQTFAIANPISTTTKVNISVVVVLWAVKIVQILLSVDHAWLVMYSIRLLAHVVVIQLHLITRVLDVFHILNARLVNLIME